MPDTQQPQESTTPAATELSTHEWDAQMDAGYGGNSAQPTGGDSTSAPAPTSQAVPPNGNPLVRWLKNLARGPGDAANAMAQTAAETSVSLKRSRFGSTFLRAVPVVGEPLAAAADAISGTVNNDPEQAKKAEVVSDAQLQAVYGPKPHDLVGGLLHGASQFTTGTLAFMPLGGAAASAAAMGAAFDPHEATVSDFMLEHSKAIEQLPIAGRVLTNVAHVLKVEPDDSPLEARVKKAIEGEAVGRLTAFILRPVVTRLAAGVSRLKGAAQAGEDDAARAAAQAKADAELARAQATPAPTDVVKVVDNVNGTYTVRPVQELREPIRQNGGRPNGNVQKFNDAVNEKFGFQPGEDPVIVGPNGEPLVRLKTTNKGGDVVEVQELRNLGGEKGAASKAMQDLNALADEHGVTLTLQASPLEEGLDPAKLRDIYRKVGFEQTKAGDANMVRRPGDAIPDFREMGNGVGAHYSDAAAAASDAATINAVSFENSRAASMFTPDEVKLHYQTAEALKNGDLGALQENPHFNLQSMGTTADVDAQIGALTGQYGDLISVAQGRPGVPNKVLHAAASQWAAEVHLDNFLPAMAQADATGRVALSLKAALYNAAAKQAGQEVAEIGMLMAAKPGDEALEFLARRRLETFLRVSEATANFNSELGRGLQALSARGAESADAIRFGSEVTPRESILHPAPQAPAKFAPLNPHNLSPEALAAQVRLFARSGGDVRVLAHVIDAMQRGVIENAEKWAKKSEVGKNVDQLVTLFINSIISGYKTMATIATSGAMMNAFHASAKVLAGVGKLNQGLAEEGAAQFYALARYAKENMRGAWAAFKENRSIIDGTPPFHVDPSPVMKAVSVPGRVAGSLDEFTRQAAYRADEYANAFRAARNEGLGIVDAAKRAELDVRTSIDQATGIGLNTAALKRAGVPTLSDNLGYSTLMGRISNVLAEYPQTKFVVPFIRPSVNTFRYSWANAPILNRFSREAQEIFMRGGEEATVLHTQALLTGAMMTYAMSEYMDGSITGNGPKDPQLRAEWSSHHEPYSVKIGGKWHSYRRAEPFATFLGLVADGIEIYHEVPEDERDQLGEKVQSAMTAVFAAGARNVTSKSWTQSLLDAFSALSDKDDQAATRYFQGIARGLTPFSAAIRQFNPDPQWREARSIMDAVTAQIPGWSETLPARYDWSGEKRARQGSMWNRNFAIAPTVDASPSIEDTLVDNYIRLAPANPRPYKGIDMWDKRWANEDGKVPYEVFMEKLAATGVRKQVEQVVSGQAFQQAPKANSSYPESLRKDLVSQVVGAAQLVALNQMLPEFPDFAQAYRAAQNIVPAIAKYQGKEAADSAQALYGIPTGTR